ncbi:MAG TPA: hypothetical protein PLP25_01265 [Candidatus Limiplasma sp.]|nr:hypothetical protein [Candidatus Limiplasma sp.]HPS80473.1 hypothetical protein [Candidatus Limiplasma sp.]
MYYESCKTGFHPALKQVGKETGIPSNKISEIRKRLNEKCLIRFKNEARTLEILWDAVTNYALKVFPKNGYGHYTPEDYYYYFVRIRTLTTSYEFKGTCIVLSPIQKRFIEYLENLTSYEYEVLLSSFPEKKEFLGKRVPYIDEAEPQDNQNWSFGQESTVSTQSLILPEYDPKLPF